MTAPGPAELRARYPGELVLLALREPFDLLRRMGQVDAPAVRARIAHRELYLLNDPDLIRELLTLGSDFVRKERAMRLLRFVFGHALFTGEGSRQQRTRRSVRSALDSHAVHCHLPAMIEWGERRGATWSDGEVIDIEAEMGRITMGVIGETMLGVDLDPEYPELSAAMQRVRLFSLRYRNPVGELANILPLPLTISALRARSQLRRTADRILARFEAAPDSIRSSAPWLMGLTAPDEPGDPLSRQELIDEIATVILAGYETTAVALTWCWYRIGRHPEVEARFHAELDEVLAGRRPTRADLPDLRFTRQLITETLRLHPPAWSFSREAARGFDLGGYAFRKGATLTVCPYSLHRNPRFWPDPDRFDPDRFLPGAGAGRPRFAFVPFSGGVRGCLGEGFAWAEISLVLATLGRAWRLRPLDDRPIEGRPLLALRPDRPVHMRVERRPAAGIAAFRDAPRQP